MKLTWSIHSWSVAVLIVLMISSGVLGYYILNTFTVPLEIKEPIEIIYYPSQWSLYPGQTIQFNVTVRNLAPLNYSVVLDFRSNDMVYQQKYVTFSDEVYLVIPGQQNLEAWLNVTAEAPAANLEVTVTVLRVAEGQVSNLLVNGDFEAGTLNGWAVAGVCSISSSIVHTGSYSTYVSDGVHDNTISQTLDLPVDSEISFEGWFYPLKTGSLSASYPNSAFRLIFYYKSSMQLAFYVTYQWCWNQHGFNQSSILAFHLPSNVNQWNFLSRSVTNDIHSYFASYNFSDIILHSLIIEYHYSGESPGAFYVDDMLIS